MNVNIQHTPVRSDTRIVIDLKFEEVAFVIFPALCSSLAAGDPMLQIMLLATCTATKTEEQVQRFDNELRTKLCIAETKTMQFNLLLQLLRARAAIIKHHANP